MKDILKFLAKLIFFSALLFVAWDIVLDISQFLLTWSCFLLGIRVTPEMHPYDSSEKLLTFVALILATPRIRIRKRIAVILVGFLLFFLMDLVSIILWISPLTIYGSRLLSEFHLVYSNAWNLAGRWILPFVFWVVAAQKEIIGLLGGFVPLPQTEPAGQD